MRNNSQDQCFALNMLSILFFVSGLPLRSNQTDQIMYRCSRVPLCEIYKSSKWPLYLIGAVYCPRSLGPGPFSWWPRRKLRWQQYGTHKHEYGWHRWIRSIISESHINISFPVHRLLFRSSSRQCIESLGLKVNILLVYLSNRKPNPWY